MVSSSYSKYRPTECSWLPSIPSHWQIKPLKFIVTCNDETLPEATDPDYEFDYVDISSVSLVEGIKARERMIFEKAPSRARRIVRRGDSIVSTVRTYLRAVATIDEDAKDLIVSTGFAVLRPGKVLRSRFLGYFVQSQGFVDTVVARSTGVSYPAILATELVTIPATIPPFDEQQAIVSFLDRETARIDELIEKKRRLLDLLEEKRLTVITHAVTKGLDPNVPMKDSGIKWLGEIPGHWEVMSLRRLARRIDVGIAEAATHAYADTGVPIIRTTNVRADSIDTNDIKFIDRWFAEKNSSKYLYAGDLLTVRTGVPGTTAVVPPELDRSQCFTMLMTTLLAGNEPRYFSAYLNSRSGRAYFEFEAWGSAQNNISVPILASAIVPVPPQSEQTAIANYLTTAVSRLKAAEETMRSALNHLAEYRSALITNAVTGKIDVRGEVAKGVAAA